MTYRAEERMRDAVRRLQMFTFNEIQQDTRLSASSVDNWLKTFQARGWVKRGRYGKTYLYHYVEPAKGETRRVKRTPAERAVVDRSGPMGDKVSGKRTRTGSPLVDGLIRRASAQGVRVRKRKHRVEYLVDDRVVATSSGTPGASSLKDTEAQLRKAGIDV